ncbi:MAG TPA: serine/threonine-protein kinase [Streptosporangiaceae bacterium]|nr:serine/threonine-protein kinase [Streptosporangiaceae bacterium]
MTSATDRGQLLAGRYRLEASIASGGAGTVWRAADIVLERMVAVKMLRPDIAGDPLARAMFLAEARSASRLSHPAIAQVYDYGEDSQADVPFLVMELVDGLSLADVVAAGPLGADRTVQVLEQVAAGLHAAHSAGVVHRDIKPANLLTTWDGQLKITDFGIAAVVGPGPPTRAGTVVGTPAYLAPERAAGASATSASDLYSLGVVAYECLTGERPFSGPAAEVSAAHLSRPFPPLPASVPAEVGLLVAALTARDPALRPRSAREVADRAAAMHRGSSDDPAWPGHPGTVLLAAKSEALEPVTLTDVMGEGAPRESASWKRLMAARQHRGWRAAVAWLAIAAALVTVGLIGWRVGLNNGSESPTMIGRRPIPFPSATGVAINSAALVGLPASNVAADLRRLGLRPQLVHVATSASPLGTVLSVRPGGVLPRGTVVIVTVAAPLPTDNHDGGGGPGPGGSDGGGGGGDGGH